MVLFGSGGRGNSRGKSNMECEPNKNEDRTQVVQMDTEAPAWYSDSADGVNGGVQHEGQVNHGLV